MVGHTHEDIDAAFSVIAEKLRTREAETLPELLSILPNCDEVNDVFDFRNWIQPFVNKVTKHTKQLHFKFGIDESGSINNQYKTRYFIQMIVKKRTLYVHLFFCQFILTSGKHFWQKIIILSTILFVQV